MLHSTTALLPTLYTAAVEGLDSFVGWMARRRRTWQAGQAKIVLGAGLLLLSIALSAWLYVGNLDRFKSPHVYEQVGTWMDENAPHNARVLVNDPPLFTYHSHLASLAIPNAGLDTVLSVMDRYQAKYLLLDTNNPALQALYLAPASDDRLELLKTFADEKTTAHLFRRIPDWLR
jgi:hypothetical protein